MPACRMCNRKSASGSCDRLETKVDCRSEKSLNYLQSYLMSIWVEKLPLSWENFHDQATSPDL